MLIISTIVVLSAFVCLSAYLLWRYAKWVYVKAKEDPKKRWLALSSVFAVTWLVMAIIKKIKFVIISLLIAGLVYLGISVGCKYVESHNEKYVERSIAYNDKRAIERVKEIKQRKLDNIEMRRILQERRDSEHRQHNREIERKNEARRVFSTPMFLINNGTSEVKYDGEGRFRIKTHGSFSNLRKNSDYFIIQEVIHELKFRHPELLPIWNEFVRNGYR